MQGFYITGTKGSYIELDDGRWADSVNPEPPHDNVEELLAELTDQADGPTFCDLSMDELRVYVGADALYQIITLVEAADITSIPYQTLRSAAREGRLEARQSGATWLVTRADVERFAQK